jgi:hypothetical protein
VLCSLEKLLTWDELTRVATTAKIKGIIKAKPFIIPKNDKYDRITLTKQKTWERLGIWLE